MREVEFIIANETNAWWNYLFFNTQSRVPGKTQQFHGNLIMAVNHGDFYYEMILNSMFIPKIRLYVLFTHY